MKPIQKLLADWQKEMGIKLNDNLKLRYFGFPGPRTRRKMMERKCDTCIHRKEEGCEKWECEYEEKDSDLRVRDIDHIWYKNKQYISLTRVNQMLKERTPERTETHSCDCGKKETHRCVYCNENECGFVKPIEKNSHAFLYRGMFEWNLELRAKGWKASVPIKFCPMCGRRLER